MGKLREVALLVDPGIVQWIGRWDEGEVEVLVRKFVRTYGLYFLNMEISLFITDQLILKIKRY